MRAKDADWLISVRDKYSEKPFNEQVCLLLFEVDKKMEEIEKEFAALQAENESLKHLASFRSDSYR